MTVARFSEDTDAKWIILIVIFVVALAVGGLMTSQPKGEGTSGSNMTHGSETAPPAETH